MQLLGGLPVSRAMAVASAHSTRSVKTGHTACGRRWPPTFPGRVVFFFLIQSNLATGSIVQHLLGKASRCPLSLPSRTVGSLLVCLDLKKCTPWGTWSSSEELTDATSERNPPTVQAEAQLEWMAFQGGRPVCGSVWRTR